MGGPKSRKPLQSLLTEPRPAKIITSHSVKPPSADRLTDCDIILAAGGGYTGRVSASIFPSEWHPRRRPPPDWIVKWLNSAAQKRGTRVLVDTQGRPMVTTVRRTKGFIDESRAARARRSLHQLAGLLEGLLEAHQEPSERLRRSNALSHLDQGLGDLIRVVRYGEESGGGRSSRRRSAGRSRGAPAAEARSSTKSKEE